VHSISASAKSDRSGTFVSDTDQGCTQAKLRVGDDDFGLFAAFNPQWQLTQGNKTKVRFGEVVILILVSVTTGR
jgi:hypothetical protein